MMRTTPRLIFCAAIAALCACHSFSDEPSSAATGEEGPGPGTRVERAAGAEIGAGETRGDTGQLRFEDVTAESRLTRVGPTYAAAAADFDRDGWADLAVSNHTHVSLYRNLGNGRFDDVSRIGDFPSRADTHGVSWVDLDSDGWVDLYVSRGAFRGRGERPNNLHFNRRGERFERQEPIHPVLANSHGRGRSAVPVDLDGDSLLDLLVMNLYSPRQSQIVAVRRGQGFEDWASSTGWRDLRAEGALVFHSGTALPVDGTRVFVPTGPGADAGKLFRMNSTGALEDITVESGIRLPRSRLVSAVVPGDYDNDGDLDLYYVMGTCCAEGPVVRGQSVHFSYDRPAPRGRDPKGFEFRATGEIRIRIWTEGRARPQGVRLGDTVLENMPWTGTLGDVPARSPSPTSEPGVDIWRTGDDVVRVVFRGSSGELQTVAGEFALRSSVPEVVRSWGATQIEFDTSNRLFANEGGKFVDVTDRAGVGDAEPGMDAVFADFDNDGDLDLYVLNGRARFHNPPNVLYRNRGDGGFDEVSGPELLSGPETGRSASVLAFDYDRDGDTDLFLTHGFGRPPRRNEGTYQLLRNETAGGASVSIVPRATASNTMSLGTRIAVSYDGKTTVREILAATGAFSTSWLPVQVGIGSARGARVEIRWPSGATAERLIRAGERLTVEEPAPEDR